MAVLWSLASAAVILSLLQENNFSISIPHREKCRTEAIKDLSRSLETRKNAKNYCIEAKMCKLTESVT